MKILRDIFTKFIMGAICLTIILFIVGLFIGAILSCIVFPKIAIPIVFIVVSLLIGWNIEKEYC